MNAGAPGEILRFTDLRRGDKAEITGYSNDEEDHRYKSKLLAMGLVRGVKLQVLQVAPLGDPIEVTVRGYELSLRKADAEMIEVEA